LKNEAGEMDQRPQALAELRELTGIRLWYFHGGGAGGNVAANTLTTLKDQIPGVSVTNPLPATGGRDEESLQNALIRGPHELHSLQRAVTPATMNCALWGVRVLLRAPRHSRARRSGSTLQRFDRGASGSIYPEERRVGGRVSLDDLKAAETSEAIDSARQSLE